MRLVLLIAILALLSSPVLCRSRGTKEKDRRKEKTQQLPNICDSSRENMPVVCYCSDSKIINNVTKAECWVFNGGLEHDHPLWNEFSSQVNLEHLSFNVRADGSLKFVPSVALQYLVKIINLDIRYASISEVAPYAFANSTTINDITLTRNQILILKHHAFAHLPNLTTLNLDENRIAEINREVFVDLPSLTKLFLTKNNISVVHDGAFRHLGHLLELEMDDNSLSVLTKDTFKGLSTLKRLSLSTNRIEFLGDFTFSELWSLQELLIDSNDLKVITERAFDGLSNLRKLVLSDNKLSMLESGILMGVPYLTYFDLRTNDLQTLTFDVIAPILENLKNNTSYFYLEENKFICDCRLSWMHGLRNSTRNERVRNTLEKVTCFLEVHTDGDTITHMLSDVAVNSNAEKKPHGPKTETQGKNGPENTNLNQNQDLEYDSDYYDDAPAVYGGDYKNNYGDNKVGKGFANGGVVNLFQIPIDKLPCPEFLLGPTEAPQIQQATGRDASQSSLARVTQPLWALVVSSVLFLVW